MSFIFSSFSSLFCPILICLGCSYCILFFYYYSLYVCFLTTDGRRMEPDFRVGVGKNWEK